jgi:alpha-D-ribose 1-methylphosphonate 5-triphosphate synthase subunit PhnG
MNRNLGLLIASMLIGLATPALGLVMVVIGRSAATSQPHSCGKATSTKSGMKLSTSCHLRQGSRSRRPVSGGIVL